MTRYNKAIAAPVAALISILSTQGIDVDPDVETAIVTLVTAAVVWLIPNKEAA